MVLHSSELESIDNCTVLEGSLYLQAQWDTNALALPPSLHTITGGLICNGSGSNPSANTITAIGLTVIASNDSSAISKLGFLVTDYTNITGLSFPNLNTVSSSFLVAGNPRLADIDGFQSLGQVGGNLTIKGDFYTVDLPSLTSVNGNVDVETSADNFTCPISPQVQSSVAAHSGSFVCAGNMKQANPTLSLGTSSISASGNSPSSTSSSSASSSSGWVHSNVKVLNLSKWTVKQANRRFSGFVDTLISMAHSFNYPVRYNFPDLVNVDFCTFANTLNICHTYIYIIVHMLLSSVSQWKATAFDEGKSAVPTMMRWQSLLT